MFNDDDSSPAGEAQETCPADEILRRCLTGQLPPDQEAACSQHLDRCPECQRRAEQITDHSAWRKELEWLPPSVTGLQTLHLSQGREPTLFLTPPESFQVTSETAFWGGGKSGQAPDSPRTPGGPIPRWKELEERFEIRETVGIGGCGTVFRAWDRRLHRQVALKVPHWPLFAQEAIRQRFAVEARAAARLSHPNIVPIFEAQIDSDVCFLASEFVEGRSLAAWLAERRSAQQPISCRLAALLVRELAFGVEAAHTQGILHRDLKPANVLLDESRSQDELPFVPRITDFGLARLSEEVGPTTIEGSVIGSLPYMSPEQAEGGGTPHDAGCDIYSLGVILYEALLGRVPILGTSPADLLQKIASQMPTEPRKLRADIPPDLQAICLKCLEKRPQDRYRAARDLAADLSSFLAGETVVARRPSLPELLIRWVRRHPTATTVVAVNFAALTVVAVVLAVANRQLSTMNVDLEAAVQLQREATRRADELRGVADAQRATALEKLYVAEVRRAAQSWSDRDLPELQRIVQRLSQPDFEPFRGIEWRWLNSLLESPYREITTLPNAVYAVVLSGSEDVLAATGKDAVVRLVRFRSGELIREWPTGQRECNDLAFADGDRVLWTTGDDGSLCQWEVATGRLLKRNAGHAPEQAHNLLTIPEKDLLISSGTDGQIRYWSLTTGAARGVVDAHIRAIKGISLFPDRQRLLSASRDDQAAIWELESQSPTTTWVFPEIDLQGFALTHDGRRLIAALDDRRVIQFELSSRQKLAEVQLLDVIDCLVIGPDGRTIFAADRRGVIHSIPDDPAGFRKASGASGEASDFERVRSLVLAHSDRIFDLHFTADGSELLSAGADGRVRAWPVSLLASERRVVRTQTETRDILPMANSTESFVFTETELGRVDARLRQVAADGDPPRLVNDADDIGDATLSPSGRIVSVEVDRAGKRNWLVIRDSSKFEPTAVWPVAFGESNVNGIEFDGKESLAVLRRHSWNELQVIELETGREQPPLVFAENVSDSATSARTGLVAISVGHRVEVFEPRTRDVRWADGTLRQSIKDLRFSEDGRYLAAACADRTIWIWDAATGKPQTQLTGHRHEVSAIAFTPDGQVLISGDKTGLLKFWRSTTGDHFYDLQMDLPGRSVEEIRIHPRSRRLLVRDAKGVVSGLFLGRFDNR